jgi:hypothetical protein
MWEPGLPAIHTGHHHVQDDQLRLVGVPQPQPLLPAVRRKEIYALAVGSGWSEADFSAIYQFLQDSGVIRQEQTND